MIVVFDGKTYDFVDSEFDILRFHVLFILSNMVGWTRQATNLIVSRCKVVDEEKATHVMKVSLSCEEVHIR